MNILFIKTTIGTSDKPYFDAGIASISAVLKQSGHNTSLFQLESWDEFEFLVKRINGFKPDIIGYSATASTCRYIGKISKRIRKAFPSIFQILGGVHITLFPEDFNNLPTLDAICLGEGEYSMLDLIYHLRNGKLRRTNIPGIWVKDKGKIIKNPKRLPIRNLDTLPVPDRKIFSSEGLLTRPAFDNKHISLEYIFTRGCPFQCTYCANHALHEFYGANYVRRRSPEVSIAEILETIDQYRADCLIFYDDIFTLDRNWLEKFLSLYRKKIKLPFICHIRVGACSQQTLSLLKRSGCFQINTGIETGSEYIRETILNRYMKNSQIINTFWEAQKLNLRTAAYVMMGFPHETITHFFDTVKLVAAIKPDITYLFIFYPYPGTKLYDLCVKEKLIDKVTYRNITERTATPLRIPTFQSIDVQYYFHNFFHICSLYQKELFHKNNIWIRLRCGYLRSLLSIPPSSRLYWVSQLGYFFDPITLLKSFFRQTVGLYWIKQ